MTPPPVRNETDPSADVAGAVPLRPGGACPDCGEDVLEVDFLDLPAIAVKREMYDVCVIPTEELPTPWQHRTAIAYHEDPSVRATDAGTPTPPYPRVD